MVDDILQVAWDGLVGNGSYDFVKIILNNYMGRLLPHKESNNQTAFNDELRTILKEQPVIQQQLENAIQSINQTNTGNGNRIAGHTYIENHYHGETPPKQ